MRCRQFYLTYPKSATVSHQLSWSHVVELLKIGVMSLLSCMGNYRSPKNYGSQ
ncbi:hypothetical protein [Pseudanabaena sp. BC1403]|uniref:hypothetical protein n=1 Tax=Pseudanabaena sp. BC1403 TaxID=2043171 RepID=UPI0021561081|nr:hypothetical protein [Pseudanabaena sp. BC1403]